MNRRFDHGGGKIFRSKEKRGRKVKVIHIWLITVKRSSQKYNISASAASTATVKTMY
jgi:hypothetical protein